MHEYDGPDRRVSFNPRRKMVLTEDDISAIARIVEERHACRYNIEPAQMTKLMGFVESFYDGAIETRKTFRTMVIRMVVWGAIAGFIALLEVRFRWIRPLLKFLSGGQG